MIIDFLKFISESNSNFALGIFIMCYIYLCLAKISDIKLLSINTTNNTTTNKEKEGVD